MIEGPIIAFRHRPLWPRRTKVGNIFRGGRAVHQSASGPRCDEGWPWRRQRESGRARKGCALFVAGRGTRNNRLPRPHVLSQASTKHMHAWIDMNEPSVFNHFETTLPVNTKHYNDFPHSHQHNLYGFYHAMATYSGLLHRDNDTAAAAQGAPSTQRIAENAGGI